MAIVKTNLRKAAGQSSQSFWVSDQDLPEVDEEVIEVDELILKEKCTPKITS